MKEYNAKVHGLLGEIVQKSNVFCSVHFKIFFPFLATTHDARRQQFPY
jgi:hypothetical protein